MKTIFYLLILLLPTQLGKHFWPEFSFIQGIRVDYLSPTIYLTDILILLLFIQWLTKKFSIFNFQFLINLKFNNFFQISNFKFQIGLAVVLVLIGIIFSNGPPAGIYGLLKLTEFILFGFLVAKIVKEVEFRNILIFLSLGIIFESLLALAQFINQSSIGGIFWFFGERTFTGSTIGIANAILDGQLILRPYGTFSHPNVLAGFLTITMAMVISNFKRLLFTSSLLIGTLGLLLTMSRVAIILWFLVMGLWFMVYLRKIKFTIYYLLFTILIVGSIIYPRFTQTSLTDETIVRRQELASAAVEMIKTQPFFGIGLNNFLINLPNFQQTGSILLNIQPVHNIYLLVAAETGLIGLGIFLWFLFKTYQRLKFSIFNFQFSIVLFAVLFLGLFDHYFLTLQQGQLLLALVLGLCWTKRA